VGAGAPVHFSARGGGGGDDYDPEDDYFEDEVEDEPAPRRRRPEERRPAAGRQRTVQTNPDDRYWTDYLRIALPVIGLLLVIAVFWYWAQQLIDDDGEDLTPTEQPGVAEVIDGTDAPATEAPGTPADLTGQQVQPPAQTTPQNPLQAFPSPTPAGTTGQQPAEQPAQQTEEGTDNQVAEQPQEEQPAEDTAAGGIAPDMVVVVTEDVNLRSGPTAAEENVVTVLTAGSELTVLSGPQESENYVWWEVVDNATAEQGWVVEDFIEPAQ
jgi:hypothetical protein